MRANAEFRGHQCLIFGDQKIVIFLTCCKAQGFCIFVWRCAFRCGVSRDTWVSLNLQNLGKPRDFALSAGVVEMRAMCVQVGSVMWGLLNL